MEENSEEEEIEIGHIINENRLNQKKPINLKGILKFGAIAEKGICKIKIPGGYGTGFFCTIPYPDDNHFLEVLITNNHVLDKHFFEEEDKIKYEINNKTYIININNERKYWTNSDIDFTIVEIRKEDNITNFLTIDENINKEGYSNSEYKNASIFIPGIMQNQEVGFDNGIILSASKKKCLFHHDCNTDSGSSGAPIILSESFTVIGIHKGSDEEKKKNVGIFLSNILCYIKQENSLKLGESTMNKKQIINSSINSDIIDDNIINEKSLNNINHEMIENQLNNNICKIYINDKEKGIGFLCIIPFPDKLNLLPVLLIFSEESNNKNIIKEKEIKLNFINYNKILLNNNKRKILDYNNNIKAIEIKKNDNFDFNNFLEIDNTINDKSNNHSIYLISNNFQKKYHINSLKKINDNKYSFEDYNNIKKGFLFSPILNLLNYKVIGIYIEKNNEIHLINMIINKFILNNEDSNNQIILKLKIENKDINKEIYFLDNSNNHGNLKELNESNVKLYINDEEYKFKKYFKPVKEGIYEIKLKLKIEMEDCSYMFSNCKNLISINLSSFNSQKVKNTFFMFSFCKSLKNIDLSYFNTENVTNMSYMFIDCEKIENIDLKSFNTKSVTNMSYMFTNCKNLKNLDLTSFSTQNVTNMSYMFSGCQNIANINVTSFNTQNVTDMTSMFYDCKNIDNINLLSFKTKNVEEMSDMFSYCSNLKNIDLSSFDVQNTDNMNGMFTDCDNLIQVKVNKKSIDKFKNENEEIIEKLKI